MTLWSHKTIQREGKYQNENAFEFILIKRSFLFDIFSSFFAPIFDTEKLKSFVQRRETVEELNW
jgi:hypothetical protein